MMQLQKHLLVALVLIFTVSQPVVGICELGWREFFGNCYYVSTSRQRYSDVENVCQQRNATVWVPNSQAEWEFVGNVTEELGTRILYWTGLHLVNHQWRWLDGTTYNKNNAHWYRKQEGNRNSGSTCAGMLSYKPYVGQLQQKNCREGWGAICRRPIDFLDVCDLDNDWHYIDGRCLKFFTMQATWFDARRICKQEQGDLTMYKNYNELLNLYEIVPCRSSENKAWIGLSDTAQARTWRWINNDTVRYSRWNSYGNLIIQNGSTCAVTDPVNGFNWEGKGCYEPYPFICNRSVGACPAGWLTNQDRCYQVIDIADSRKTWFDSKRACESQGTSLLIINSDSEQQFIASTLAGQHIQNAWLAFSDTNQSNVLYWTDGRLTTGSGNYQHWASNFPQLQDKMFDCGLITRGSQDSRWSNAYCYNYLPYICEMKITESPYLPTPTQAQVHCSSDWSLFQSHCYYFGPQRNQSMKTWTEARDYCSAAGGYLVILDDPYEISYVTVQQNAVITAWIGLRYNVQTKQLTWVNGAVPGQNWVRETNFRPGEPDDLDDGQYCMQIVGGQRTYSGSWDDGNCTKAQGFICEKIAPAGAFPRPTTSPPFSNWSPLCGLGWIYDSIENFCYQAVLNKPKSWLEAQSDCRQRGGDLASVTGRREQNFIQAMLTTGRYSSIQVNYWIGATDQSREGGWEWSDKTAFAYLNWYPGEPNNKIRGVEPEDCAEIVPAWTYQWNDQRCGKEQLYICKKTAKVTTGTTFTPPTEAPMTKTCVGEPMLSGNYSVVDDTAFDASSSRDSRHQALDSRWYQGSHGAWSSKFNNGTQYISVYFFNTIVVKGVITAGRTDMDEWVTKYKLQYQEDYFSEWLTYNQPPGTEMIFHANSNATSPVTNMIAFPFEARKLRLLPIAWQSGISLRWEILGCMEEDCNPDFGVSGPLIVDDSALTASPGAARGHGAVAARMRSIRAGQRPSCWIPTHVDANQWIQVDLGQPMVIRGVSTLGNPSQNQWVTSYKVSYSLNTQTFKFYQEPYTKVKTLMGNTDARTTVTNFFKSHFQARYVRIIPLSWNGSIALRFDVLVCPHGCKGIPLINGEHPLDNSKLNASSLMNTQHGAFRSRLRVQAQRGLGGAWIPRFNDRHQYIEVDLGNMIHVTAVATQGASDYSYWTQSYQLSYSNDRRKWFSYYELGLHPKLFPGNWDRNTVRKHFLVIPFIARYVRLWPIGFHSRMAVRWELYGCPGADSGTLIGCYADDQHALDLPYEPYTDPSVGMWPPMCVHHCFRQGYFYAGIQNHYQCYCGNSYGRYGPATDCNLRCLPKTDFFCGGPTSNNVYSTGLNSQFKICPSHWKAYKNRCYILLLDTRAWYDARAACQLEGGDLATPNSQQEQDFVYSLLQYGRAGGDAWIGLNDIRDENVFEWAAGGPVLYTNWNVGQPRHAVNEDEDCISMSNRTGGWQDEACDAPRMYVCEMNKRAASQPSPPRAVQGCQQGWDGYRWSCYLYADSPRTWNQAFTACSALGATLVVMNDRFEQAYLSSVLGEKVGMYWTDLADVKKPGTYTFSDISEVLTYSNWAQNKPDVTQQCVAMGSNNASGLWYNVPCSSKLGMICEKRRIGYTLPPKPPATPIPPRCPPGLIQYGAACYQVNVRPPNQQLSWEEARRDCENQGGTLASFHNASGMDYVVKSITGVRSGIWIGLNDRDVENGYVWTDGTPVQFTNWRRGEPNNFRGIEDCVELALWDSTWNDNPCSATKNWMCTYKAGSMCAGDTGWSYYNGFCYLVNDGSGNKKKTWRQARQSCQLQGSDLTSITSLNEQLFISKRLFANITGNAFYIWIGLNEIDSDHGYSWSDKTQVSFIYWGTSEPNNYGGAEDCVAMSVRNGNWTDVHCATAFGYVCKKHVGTTPTPIAPTVPWIGFCPSGFSLYRDRCYRVYPTSVNWTTASSNCQRLGKGYYLASVENDLENDFITTMLADMNINPWIGMKKNAYQQWKWINNDDTTFTNWARGEPNGRGKAMCVYIYGAQQNIGQWNDIECWDPRGYICQTARRASITTPEAVPSVCDASRNFQQFLTGCYLVVKNPMSWREALSFCRQQSASLVSINSDYEQAFVHLLAQSQVGDAFWIGFNDIQMSGRYLWSDGWPAMYTRWDKGQPVHGPNGGCVKFNSSGLWSDTNCNQTLPAICKRSSVPPPLTPPPPNGSCSDPGWYAYGSNCYQFNAVPRSILDATLDCQSSKATVVSIHNKTVNDYLVQKMRLLVIQTISFWTSLHKSLDSGFRWIDNSPLQFTNWNPGEPSIAGWSGNSENCVEVLLATGQWNDEDCASKRAYVCEKKQVADLSPARIATAPGGIRIPTPIPHSIPSILPSQRAPTPRTHYTGPPTPSPPSTVPGVGQRSSIRSVVTETSNPGRTGTETSNPGRTGTETSNPGRTGTETSNPGRTGTETSNPGRTGTETSNTGRTGPGSGTTKQPQILRQTQSEGMVALHPAALAGIIVGTIIAVCLLLGFVLYWRRNSVAGVARRLGHSSTGFENQIYRYDTNTEQIEETDDDKKVTVRSLSESSS